MENHPVSPMMYSLNLNGTTINTVIDPDILGQFWTTLVIQLSPANDLIAIPGATFRILDEGGKHFIAHNFACAVGDTLVKYVIDGSGTHPDRYFLGRAGLFRAENIVAQTGQLDVWVPPGHTPPSSVLTPQNAAGVQALSAHARRTRGGHVKVPRPPNAYILYRKDRHKAVKQSNPSLSNNEISVILGRQWNEEEDEIRMHYHLMAVEIKQQVERMHPNYKYSPRKSSEIRRRARGNQGQGLYDLPNTAAANAVNTTAQATMPTPPLDFDLTDILTFGIPNPAGDAIDQSSPNSDSATSGSVETV